MIGRAAWLAGSIAFAALAPARAPAAGLECAERFYPERPGATNSHATVGIGCVHLDSYVLVTSEPSPTSVALPHLFRVGLELRVGYDCLGLTAFHGGPTQAAPSSHLLAAKIMGVEEHERVPGPGVTAGAVAPGDGASSRTVSPSTALLFDWSFVEAWAFSLNGLLSGAVRGGPVPALGPLGLRHRPLLFPAHHWGLEGRVRARHRRSSRRPGRVRAVSRCGSGVPPASQPAARRLRHGHRRRSPGELRFWARVTAVSLRGSSRVAVACVLASVRRRGAVGVRP